MQEALDECGPLGATDPKLRVLAELGDLLGRQGLLARPRRPVVVVVVVVGSVVVVVIIIERNLSICDRGREALGPAAFGAALVDDGVVVVVVVVGRGPL